MQGALCCSKRTKDFLSFFKKNFFMKFYMKRAVRDKYDYDNVKVFGLTFGAHMNILLIDVDVLVSFLFKCLKHFQTFWVFLRL